MAEKSGAKIQLGDAADPYLTKERIIKITAPAVANVALVNLCQ